MDEERKRKVARICEVIDCTEDELLGFLVDLAWERFERGTLINVLAGTPMDWREQVRTGSQVPNG